MREIKFRAWDKTYGRMWNGFELNEGRFIYPPEVAQPPEKKLIFMQYTGIFDMKGRMIFEGDILEYVSPIEDEPPRDIYVVEWHGHGFRATWWKDGAPAKNQGMDGLTGADEDMQVVGNLYETPELLAKAVV